MEYLTVGFFLWILANAFGANLGPEHILTLPVFLGIVLYVLLIMGI